MQQTPRPLHVAESADVAARIPAVRAGSLEVAVAPTAQPEHRPFTGEASTAGKFNRA